MAAQNDKKPRAKKYYLTGHYQQKEIAKLVDISEQTLCRWVKDEAWESLKTSLITTRENELKRLYKILANLNEATEADIDAGIKVNPKDADAAIKYSAAIKNLEIETSVAEKVEVGMEFINFVRKTDVEKSKELTKLFDQYLSQFI